MMKYIDGEWDFGMIAMYASLIAITITTINIVTTNKSVESPAIESHEKACELNDGLSFINNSSYSREPLIFVTMAQSDLTKPKH